MAELLLTNAMYEAREVLHADSGPLVLLVTGADAAQESEKIALAVRQKCGKHFSFVTLEVKEWDAFLTPWPDKEVSRNFAGRGGELLQSVSKELLSILRERFHTDTVYLAGYSLAGLFALWALYESPEFAGAACCSGSLWYEGWTEYAASHRFQRPVRVLLSLGKKEEKAGNAKMCRVGENTRRTQELLIKDAMAENDELLWHDGGHFSGVSERIVTGICRILNKG